jgi:predicted amidophosphoribosyltransferase
MEGSYMKSILCLKQVVCEKCGAASEDIRGRCPQCGEFLFPFYRKQKLIKLVKLFSTVFGFLVLGFKNLTQK